MSSREMRTNNARDCFRALLAWLQGLAHGEEQGVHRAFHSVTACIKSPAYNPFVAPTAVTKLCRLRPIHLIRNRLHPLLRIANLKPQPQFRRQRLPTIVSPLTNFTPLPHTKPKSAKN